MDWDGWMDGIGSPGGRGYRAPYGANNDDDAIEKIIDDADNDKNEDNLRPQLWLRRPHFLSQFSPPSPIACAF